MAGSTSSLDCSNPADPLGFYWKGRLLTTVADPGVVSFTVMQEVHVRGGWVVAVALAALGSGCTPHAARKPIEMEPIGTVDPSKLPPKPKEDGATDTPAPAASASTSPSTPSDPPAGDSKSAECTGGKFDNLYMVLTNKSCEVDAKGERPADVKSDLEVKVSPSTSQIVPGGRVDLVVSFRNKGSRPLPLYFALDPAPRFDVEATDGKGRPAGAPAGKPPKKPTRTPTRTIAKVTLSPGGTAKMKTGWTASNHRWATEQVKGEVPETGYPRTPTTPLAKGTYSVRVTTPLILVQEGADRELSAPKVAIEVAE